MEMPYLQPTSPAGASLYVQEIGTDDHYILSDKKYPVVFEYAGQDVAKVEIEANDGEAIENTLKRGKVSGWKVDQDGFELGGAVIGLFRFDETEFTEETALMVTESNEIGYFEFDKVPAGNFLVREIAPPKAFVLTEETFPVELLRTDRPSKSPLKPDHQRYRRNHKGGRRLSGPQAVRGCF